MNTNKSSVFIRVYSWLKSGRPDARCLAIAFIKRPRFFETTHRTWYRAVILMDPFVVLRHFVDQARLFPLLARGQAVKIARIALQLRQRRRLHVVHAATNRVAC